MHSKADILVKFFLSVGEKWTKEVKKMTGAGTHSLFQYVTERSFSWIQEIQKKITINAQLPGKSFPFVRFYPEISTQD